MCDLILISPHNTQLGQFKRFVPRSVPIGIGLLAGYLRAQGISAKLLDQELVALSPKTLPEYLAECRKPRIVGISVMTANVATGYTLARIIKDIDPETIVVFGGIHATVMPDEILRTGNVDFVVKGEAEYTFLELIRQIKSGSIEPDKLENTGYIEDGKVVYSKPAQKVTDLNDVPSFPYDMFDPSRYNLGFILTSRGCPFDCIFCSQRVITKRRYRPIPIERVIGELDYLVNDLHQPNITFFDDYFTGDKKRVMELCDLIRQRGLDKKASFGVQTRGDSVDRELLTVMRQANFDSLMFGVETASEDLMKLINKRETVQDNVEAIRLAREMNFVVEATFIYGFPTETWRDRFDSLSLAVNSGVDRARFNNVTPYPGTRLYEMVGKEIKIAPGWINFSSAAAVTAGIGNKYPLPYSPESCSEKELAGMVLLANLLFYLNFSSLKKLFNPEQKGSGKWFEVAKGELLSPRVMIELLTLGVTVAVRSLYYIITSRQCRRFFFQGLRL